MKIIQSINKKALVIAAISFTLGTLLLLFFLISQYQFIIGIGVFYVLIASILNAITFIELVGNSIINYQYYRENLTTLSVVALNIPITIGYAHIVFTNPIQNLFI